MHILYKTISISTKFRVDVVLRKDDFAYEVEWKVKGKNKTTNKITEFTEHKKALFYYMEQCGDAIQFIAEM